MIFVSKNLTPGGKSWWWKEFFINTLNLKTNVAIEKI